MIFFFMVRLLEYCGDTSMNVANYAPFLHRLDSGD
uniref:Uncharacterized protein n=1 Tax=Rhizophora mucronata TaxID=61149 RepID=A0A2P2Q8B6_RHIMU